MKRVFFLLIPFISVLASPLLHGARQPLAESAPNWQELETISAAETNVDGKPEETSRPEESVPPPPVPSDNPFHYYSTEQRGEEGDQGAHLSSELMKLVGSIALFTILLLLLNWMLKRITNNRQEQLNATSDIRVLEKRILSHKACIYLIEIRGKTIAVAEAQGGIAKLTEFTDQEEEDA